jgi:hypothetical protein
VEADLLQAHLDDHLRQVCDHLRHSPDCQDEYAALRRLAELEAQGALPPAEDSLAHLPGGAASQPVPHLMPGP